MIATGGKITSLQRTCKIQFKQIQRDSDLSSFCRQLKLYSAGLQRKNLCEHMDIVNDLAVSIFYSIHCMFKEISVVFITCLVGLLHYQSGSRLKKTIGPSCLNCQTQNLGFVDCQIGTTIQNSAAYGFSWRLHQEIQLLILLLSFLLSFLFLVALRTTTIRKHSP